MQNNCDLAGANPVQKKFEEGKKFGSRAHQKMWNKSTSGNFTAVCLQTSQLRENSYEINDEVLKDARIKNNFYVVSLFCSFLYCLFQIYLHLFYNFNNNI